MDAALAGRHDISPPFPGWRRGFSFFFNNILGENKPDPQHPGNLPLDSAAILPTPNNKPTPK